MNFAKKLKEIRSEKGYTQRYISEIVNKTVTAVCDWERGRTQPSIEDLITISKIFDCSIDYLLGIEDENGLAIQTTTNTLSADEERVLQNYRKIQQPHIKQMVESYIENVIEIEKQDLKKEGIKMKKCKDCGYPIENQFTYCAICYHKHKIKPVVTFTKADIKKMNEKRKKEIMEFFQLTEEEYDKEFDERGERRNMPATLEELLKECNN